MGSFSSLSFGNVAQAGLSEEFVLGDLTVVGSLAGGGDLGNVDLVYVPEPASVLLLSVGLAVWLFHFGRVIRSHSTGTVTDLRLAGAGDCAPHAPDACCVVRSSRGDRPIQNDECGTACGFCAYAN